MTLFSTFALAYFFGSIPFGLLLSQAAGLGDIRTIGSGNIGATNVLRSGRKGLALLTLLFDAGKGAAAVMLAQMLYPSDYAPLAALFAVVGHVFPVWLQFQGGKGVATAIGALIALNWVLGAAVCALWLLAFLFTRTSSLASLIAIGWSGAAAYVMDDFLAAILCLCLAAIITFTHHTNIKRLLAGNEPVFRSVK